MRSGAVVCLHLFHLAIHHSTSIPHPLTPLLCPCMSSSTLYSSVSPFPSLSFSIFACLFPLLPAVLSYPAKRLVGVFSSVVTFKTECHHCLSVSFSLAIIRSSHLSLPLPLHICLPAPHPPPAARAFWTKSCA